MAADHHRVPGIARGFALALAASASLIWGAVPEAGGSTGQPGCTYAISHRTEVFDPPATTSSFQVTTNDPACAWNASTPTMWVEITNGSGHTGSGPLAFAVEENDTPHQRMGTIWIHGSGGFTDQFTIVQNHPWIPVNFEFNVFSPEIGETVTFTTDPRLEVHHWDFGLIGCQGRGTRIYCSGAAGDCDAVQWSWADAGAQTITMATTTGTQSKSLNVQPEGRCPESCGGLGPDDGSAENGYGWATGTTFVQKFTPEIYPWVLTDACFSLTQAAGTSSLFLYLLVFDDDGPNGAPGSLLASIETYSSDVPAWLDHRFYSVPIPTDQVQVEDGAVYVGVGWYPATAQGFYVAADESVGIAASDRLLPRYRWAWIPLSTTFPSYRSLLLRTDGYPVADGEWQLVSGSDRGAGNGFGFRDNSTVSSMTPYRGSLLIGTANRHGARIHTTNDGESWWPIGEPGLGDPTNRAITTLIPFGDHVYATTENPHFGAEIWRAATPPDWSLVEGGGFGDPSNLSVTSAAVFSDSLYVGTNSHSGCEVWRSSDGVTWTQVNNDGFGDPYNQIATSMAVFGGELYVGTSNSTGAEIWKSHDGIDWTRVMAGGFDTVPNLAVDDLAVFRGALYAGASNPVTGAQVWRSFDGVLWLRVVEDGFGNPGNTEFGVFAVGDLGIYASASGPAEPGSVWFSADGSHWQPSSSPGFADQANTSVDALVYWMNRAWAGTANPNAGCEVWRGALHTLFGDGFESGDTGGWAATTP